MACGWTTTSTRASFCLLTSIGSSERSRTHTSATISLSVIISPCPRSLFQCHHHLSLPVSSSSLCVIITLFQCHHHLSLPVPLSLSPSATTSPSVITVISPRSSPSSLSCALSPPVSSCPNTLHKINN